MSLRGYVRQLKPRTENYIPPVDRVQKEFALLEELLPTAELQRAIELAELIDTKVASIDAQTQSKELIFVKVDTQAEQALGGQFNIRSIPTLMVFKNGKVIDQLSGALPQQQFMQWLNDAVNK
jgi:thiol-disulfide isomerase/thioredoxin